MSSSDHDAFGLQQRRTCKRPNDDVNRSTAARKKFRKRREYSTYHYDPLPRSRGTIRILELFPNQHADSGIHCALITPPEHEISQYPYEALSWCWGVSGKIDYIQIQGKLNTYDKSVSPNLVAAMKALRYPDRKRYLWIDMVCIDQDNLDEKNHQVEMMDIIYGNAERVCIWLGEANESSRMALRFIKEEVSQLRSFDVLCDSKDASKKWAALLDLMQRPWFSRRWVVQELALAHKPLIYCGHDKISWKKFAIAVELFVEVETATHRLSEVMKKDRQYQYIPSYFEFVSALGASLLVDATERLFRDYKEVKINQSAAGGHRKSSAGSDSETSSETSDSEDSDASTLLAPHSSRNNSKNRIQPLLSLEYLVSSLTIFETTVPHDTIYALLAIAKDTSPRAVAPGAVLSSRGAQEGLEIYTQRKSYNVDYNLPYIDVCKDFISFSIERSLHGNQSRALDVICRPWAIEERKLKNVREDKKRKKEKVARDAKREKDKRERRENKKDHKADKAPVSNPSNSEASHQSQMDSNSPDGVLMTADQKAELEDMSLPSWVPQLSGAPYAMARKAGLAGPKMSRINADPLVGLPSPTQQNYSAAETKGVDMKTLRFRKRSALGHFSMYVRGFKLATIKDVEQVARNGQIPREWAELGAWEGAQGHPPDEFWRTLVANRGKDGKNPPVYYSRACEESFKKGGIESGAVDTTSLIDYERNSVVAQFCRRVQAVTWNRALVKTEDGRLGMVGKHVQKGDIVCILYGCSVPVILRESKRKEEDVLNKEIEQELRDVKNTVVQSFRRFLSRKRRHEVRKDLEMAQLFKPWFESHKRLYTTGRRPGKRSAEEAVRNNQRLYSAAFKNLQILWADGMQKSWVEKQLQDEKRKLENARSQTSKAENNIGEQLQEHVRPDQTAQAQPQSTTRNMESPTLPRSSVNGTAVRPSKDSLVAIKKEKPAIDWWAFEYALAAGRHWKRFVKQNKERRAAFALTRSESEWAEERRERYKEFEKWRRKEGKWDDTELPEVSEGSSPKNPSVPSQEARTKTVEPGASQNHSGRVVRPCWARKINRDKLTEEECSDYDSKIRNNLRSRLGNEGYYSYEFLGECYIHGAMDGEAMLYQNEGDGEVIPSIVFEIR